jgi:Protein of unknown function (DUF1501)
MKLSRRALLAASLGAGQLALLDRYTGTARAAARGPTRLVVFYLRGGARIDTFFTPLTRPEIERHIPVFAKSDHEPSLFTPDQVTDLSAGGSGRKLRLAKLWNPAKPSEYSEKVNPSGYSWEKYDLAKNTIAFHGIDHGSVAHYSAYTAAVSGLPGDSYRAPALVSIIANHFQKSPLGANRPIPCVALLPNGLPSAFDLPSTAAPLMIPDFDSLSRIFSADEKRNSFWVDRNARTPQQVAPWSTGAASQRLLTPEDQFNLEETLKLKSRSSAGNDTVYEALYGAYAGVSNTLAQDIVGVVEKIPDVKGQPDNFVRLDGNGVPSGDTFFNIGIRGGNDALINMKAEMNWTLRLLKSGATTSIFTVLETFNHDTHGSGTMARGAHRVRAELECIAQFLGQLKATPNPDGPGTLFDDTLVLVTSEFSRTWSTGPNQSGPTGWDFQDDHNQMTSLIVAGGSINGNSMIGGYENGGKRGSVVKLTSEDGTAIERAPLAVDVMATLCTGFGLKPKVDFFYPGGYGVIPGLFNA